MLGSYENFPENIHRIAHFTFTSPSWKLQHTLTHAFRKLNGDTLNLEAIADPSIPQCTVNFEFGIAEDNGFNYLNDNETDRILKTTRNTAFHTMDFLCVIRYYRTKPEKKTPLRFDYYMLRFVFDERSLEIRVFHEKGPRYTSPEDIINLVIDRVNETSKKQSLKALNAS